MPLNILVVDDNQPIREIMMNYVVQLGHRCTPAQDGTEAINRIKGETFDGLLLDVVMPQTDGFEVLRWINKNGLKLPVVVFSTGVSEHSLDYPAMSQPLGAIKGFDKPVTKEKVREAIAEITAWNASNTGG